MGKEARFLGRVTTLGRDRFVITVPKEDNPSIEHLKGKRVFVVAREATEQQEDTIDKDDLKKVAKGAKAAMRPVK